MTRVPPISRIPFFDADCFPDPVRLVHTLIHRDYRIGVHRHGFVELNVVIAGQGQHWVAGSWLPVGRGDAFVIPAGMPHAYQDGLGLDVYHLILRQRFLHEHALDLRTVPGYTALFTVEPYFRNDAGLRQALRLDEDACTRVTSELDRIGEEQSATPPNHVGAEALAVHLITVLCRLYAAQRPESGQPAGEQSIRAALDRCSTRFTERIEAADLAAAAGLPLDEFNRLFRAVTGMSPALHIASLRIRAARDLLADADRSLTAIALDLGFYDSAHFSRTFHRLVGVTPSAYRRRLSGAAEA